MSRWLPFLFVLVVFASGIQLMTWGVSKGFRLPQFWAQKVMGQPYLTKEHLAQFFGTQDLMKGLPESVAIPLEGKILQSTIQYSIDTKLQNQMQKLFESYRPDFGAFVAIEPTTGKVLSMVSYSKHKNEVNEHLALRATFPAASVFKVVTAAAAIEEQKYTPETQISVNGRNHTLYKSAVLKPTVNRWTRQITLKQAFAQSVNSVFGKIGLFSVGPSALQMYADRFGFNREIPSDLPVEIGKAPIPDDRWGIVEAASGFTKDNTMSPLQGALIAAAVVNDGVMMEPYVVESVQGVDSGELYRSETKVMSTAIDTSTARELRELMRETVHKGTSKSMFRTFFRGAYKNFDVGGKTGSLTGHQPQGKYDWFVGYAEYGNQRMAFAALTINREMWTVKSSHLARKAIESYFSGK